MFRSLTALTICLVGLNAFAQPASIQADLTKVDKFSCDIEIRGDGQLRILSTSQNPRPNRYLDLDLSDKEMIFTYLPNGWQMSKTVDLYKQAMNPIFPSWTYGNEVTSLTYEVDSNGSSKLSVSFTPSTVALPGSRTTFDCLGAGNVHLDKKLVCPTCLSSQK